MTERDQHVDRLLREAMRGPVRAETADCLDVEMLAAWSEGSLDAGERSRAEAHAATCTRCQSMLAAMIRTAPIVAAAPPSPFRKWMLILGPALGATAAVALWIAIDQPARDTGLPAQTAARVEQLARSKDREEAKQVDRDAPTAQPSVPEPSSVAALRSREADKSLADERDAKVKKEGTQALDRLADADSKRLSAAKPAQPGAVAGTVSVPAESPRSVVAPQAAPPPPPAAPAPPAAAPRADQSQVVQVQVQSQAQNQTLQNQRQNAGPSQVQNQAPSPSTNAGQVSQAAPAARRAGEATGAVSGERRENETAAATPMQTKAAGAGRGGGVAQGAPQDSARAESFRGRQETNGSFDIPTSNTLIRYRVVDGRTVQRTTDGGKTWTTGHVVLAAPTLTTGTAPSPTVCWLAGTGGLVLTTSDGVTWREVKGPEAADIRSIVATDANSVTVITANGRAFITTNGGLSWVTPR